MAERGLNSFGKFALVCFADASVQAMCAAVYLRYESNSGEVSAGLLTSKTKVAPAKRETLPRLELCASLLVSRLLDKVVSAISVNAKVAKGLKNLSGINFDQRFIFLDSKIALGTLNKGSLCNDFTGNCVAEVRGKTENCVFAWVQSEDNVADLGTRGTTPDKVGPDSEWQRGPAWMYEPIDSWPVEVWPLVELPTIQNVNCTGIIDVEKFSCLDRLHTRLRRFV